MERRVLGRKRRAWGGMEKEGVVRKEGGCGEGRKEGKQEEGMGGKV